MHKSLQDLEDEALKLPAVARGELAAKLLDSLESTDAEAEQQWIAEAERRAADVRSGRVEAEPIRQALARIRATLG